MQTHRHIYMHIRIDEYVYTYSIHIVTPSGRVYTCTHRLIHIRIYVYIISILIYGYNHTYIHTYRYRSPVVHAEVQETITMVSKTLTLTLPELKRITSNYIK